jgi:hypothetical protein
MGAISGGPASAHHLKSRNRAKFENEVFMIILQRVIDLSLLKRLSASVFIGDLKFTT